MVYMALITAFPLMHLLMVQLAAGTIVYAEATEEKPVDLEISWDQKPEEQFEIKHITGKNITNCTKAMVKVNKDGHCKPVNTFIHSNKSEVNKVCKKGISSDCKEISNYSCFKSSVKFNLTICKKKRSSSSCVYKRVEEKAYVVLGCSKKHQAVHFERIQYRLYGDNRVI